MASLSGICSSSPSLKPKTSFSAKPFVSLRRDSVALPARLARSPAQSVAREVSAELSSSNDGVLKKKVHSGLEKDPRELWKRYVDWLYQHKELGLYLDVSRIGFADEFVEEMEPKFQQAFKAMEELEKGAIANPDEGRMVGHYWLRKSELAPTSFLKTQIENTLDAICSFADDVVSGKVSWSLPSVVSFASFAPLIT